MSQQNKFLELLKDNVKRFGSEVSAEMQHQVGRGASEIANLLYGGNGFVLYGHGASHPANVNQLDQGKEPSPDIQQGEGHEQSRGRSM